jgi:hypothetical protein
MDENLLTKLIQPQDTQILSALFYGCEQTWILEGDNEELTQFCVRWAPFSRETLLRILENGTRLEKVCALFSLGHLRYDEDQLRLREYLQGRDEWEQWASAIELWKQGEKRALPVLQTLMCEESLIELWHHPEEDPKNFAFWSTQARRLVISLFATGESTEVILLLSKTLRWCWKIERQFDELLDRWADLQEAVFSWEDLLVYGLGRFHIWDSTLQDQLPAGRIRIAQIIWILGFLQAHNSAPHILKFLGTPTVISMTLDYITGSYQKIISEWPGLGSPKETMDIHQVKAALGQKFGFSLEQQEMLFTQFHKDCMIRVKQANFLFLSSKEIRKRWVKDFSLTEKEPEDWNKPENIVPTDDFDLSFDPYQ